MGKYSSLLNNFNYKLCNFIKDIWVKGDINKNLIKDENKIKEYILLIILKFAKFNNVNIYEEIQDINIKNYKDINGGFLFINFINNKIDLYCKNMMLINKKDKFITIHKIYTGSQYKENTYKLDYFFFDHQELRRGNLECIEDAMKIYNEI